MASKKTIIKAFAAIKTIYNYFGKDANIELMVDTWDALLAEYSDDEVEKGVFMALKVCKYAPVPADVIEQIETLQTKNKPCETELWAQFRKALKEVNYYSYRLEYNYIDDSGLTQGEQARQAIQRIWDNLPEELRIYVGDKSELIAVSKALNYSQEGYERARFSKVFPVLRKRVEANAVLENTKKKLLERF